MREKLIIQPISFTEACTFVKKHHRHHRPPQGWKFGIAVSKGDTVVGVAMIGRPVARHYDDGWTMEITRLCTDCTPNAASKLLGAARRATFALGYKRLITYTLASEGGTSLKASGYKLVGTAGGGSWDCPSRPRVDKHPTIQKHLWEVTP